MLFLDVYVRDPTHRSGHSLDLVLFTDVLVVTCMIAFLPVPTTIAFIFIPNVRICLEGSLCGAAMLHQIHK